MRKLILQMQVTLDGFVAGPKGEMDWMVWNWDEELQDFVNEITEPVDCIVLGRVLAESFIHPWAARAANLETADSFAHKMNDSPKVVFSRTMNNNVWERTRITKGDIVKEITELKNQPGGDIITYGGGNFASDLIKHGLVDEYYLFVNPAAIGDGMTIFKSLEQKLQLKLMEANFFPCGIVVLNYQPLPPAKAKSKRYP